MPVLIHRLYPTENENMPCMVGWDAAGEVIAAGPDCTFFEKGDETYL